MPTQIELDDDTFAVVHELILRGLKETDPTERRYGEAYDTFLEGADAPLRIGEQPAEVQEVWEEIVQDGSVDHRRRENQGD